MTFIASLYCTNELVNELPGVEEQMLRRSCTDRLCAAVELLVATGENN